MKPEILTDLKALLPKSISQMVDTIGFDATYVLIQNFGGRTLRVTQNLDVRGESKFHELEELIGNVATNRLVDVFGGEIIYIPKCEVAMREYRDRMIRGAFDELSKELSSTVVVNQLASNYKLSDRQIWHILKNSDLSAMTIKRKTDEQTIDMFGE